MQLRKLVHLSGAAFAFIALFSPYLALVAVGAGIAAFLALEGVKGGIHVPLLSSLYRDGERAGIAYEPLFYLASIASLLLISLSYFPPACDAAIIVLTVGDGLASMVGRAFGKYRLPHSEKTLEGTLSGFAVAAAVGFIFAGPVAVAGAAAGMAVEAYAPRFENVSVAASALLVMVILSLLA